MASKESKLVLLHRHVSDLSDQKDEVNTKKSELLQKKDIAISDVTEKCESLKKSINKSKTSAIRQLNEFYETQEKLLNDALANLETRIARAEEELIIDLNGIPVPSVKTMLYDFDVTKVKTSIDQLELMRSPMSIQSPSGETKGSTSKGSETIKTTCSSKSEELAEDDYVFPMIRLNEIKARANLPKQLNVPTPKKPRLFEGQRREHVRDYIKCNECKKPRCIYRDYFLTDEEKLALSKLKHSASYICGEQLPTDKYKWAKTLVVEDKIECASNVNWHYFHPKLRNPLVCYMCGTNSVSPMSEEEKQEYSALHKICSSCQWLGGKPRCLRKTRREDGGDDDENMDDSD